ncbi:MAG: class I SAM-dependent methyltransferase [Candidatus Acidiferrales bacterium]
MKLVNAAKPESKLDSEPQSRQLIRNVSDTALWVAVYRADESDRADAHFHDSFARRLAGQRGQEIADAMPFQKKNSWPFVARTVLFDAFINEQVNQGAEMVVNLAAGLDARPYRMALPASLQWIEVDLPGILDYKEGILAGEKPVCSLERIRLDLANISARRELFQRLGQRAKKVLVVSEGLLGYLSEEEVGSLAVDLARPASFERWVLDIGSPALMRMIMKKMNTHLDKAGAPLKFGPQEGPGFFTRYGWKPVEVRSVFKAAEKLNRLPLFMRLISLISDTEKFQAKRPWSGICLFEKK